MPGALDGIRVLDFTIAQQGPYATMLLSDMGAEVIKVEQPFKGDVGRALGVDRKSGVSAYFLAINRGKKSIVLDLKSERARQVALRLARGCDVVVSNFRPGVMEKLGLDYEAFCAVNPAIIYASATAFGTQGPMGTKPGNDLLAQAVSGLMSVTGEGEAPIPVGAAIADHLSALTLALGIVSALVSRDRTGRGQKVESSLLGSTTAAQSWELTYYMMTREPPGKAGRGNTYLLFQWYTYRTLDGWLAVGGVDPSRWSRFCQAIDWPELETDARFDTVGKRLRDRQLLNDTVDAHIATRKTEEWLARLEAADIFCAPVLDYEQVTSHEQMRANGYIGTMQHPKLGETRIIPCPIAFSETPARSDRPEPARGEHTRQVLLDGGFSEDEIAALRADGAL